MGLEAEKCRIVEWGIEANVERLLSGGLQSPQSIAHKLDADPDIKAVVGEQVVRPHDVKVYMAHKNARKQDALAKSLSHSEDGRALIEAAKSRISWLVEFTELLRQTAPKIMEDFESERERWADAIANPKLDKEGRPIPVYYPEAQLRAMEKVARLVKDVAEGVIGDEKTHQLLKAGSITVNNGISQAEMFETLARTISKVECPTCGYKSFDRLDVSRAFARAQADKAIDTTLAP